MDLLSEISILTAKFHDLLSISSHTSLISPATRFRARSAASLSLILSRKITGSLCFKLPQQTWNDCLPAISSRLKRLNKDGMSPCSVNKSDSIRICAKKRTPIIDKASSDMFPTLFIPGYQKCKNIQQQVFASDRTGFRLFWVLWLYVLEQIQGYRSSYFALAVLLEQRNRSNHMVYSHINPG
ncbi:uncharacterized protein BDR25DRAFT_354221 [Lindgomyces ingoldianus]|uniref:Uncharacterized protein n=1 Tax=Lindgomyces ingoldianus TaxID=673940 RepID=A0ACB6QXG9_9PLEO|nr:uncharacterized protein BDR25DRAFT_354221 [Lindgomyces ingoldianus]KAF2471729.1 hypothetical protein BDR25DRAFT_354221 [Lindgomyces ingoldianus]